MFFNFLYVASFFMIYRSAIDWQEHELNKWEKTLKDYVTGNSAYDRLKFSLIGGLGVFLMNINLLLAGLVSWHQLLLLGFASVALSTAISEGARTLVNKISLMQSKALRIEKTEKEVEV